MTEFLNIFRLLEIPALIFAALALVLQWRLLCSKDNLLAKFNSEVASEIKGMASMLASLAELVRMSIYKNRGGGL